MDEYDVIGIGSLLLDFVVETDDSVLEDIGLKKGDNAYYYVRAPQFDGERGWTSPIWVNYN